MNDVDKYKALAYSLRSRAQTADPAVQRKDILALAARLRCSQLPPKKNKS